MPRKLKHMCMQCTFLIGTDIYMTLLLFLLLLLLGGGGLLQTRHMPKQLPATGAGCGQLGDVEGLT